MPKRKCRILVSVTDKRGLECLKPLFDRGDWEFISTGGTAKALAELGIACTPVEQITNFPEMMGGRVKTLHPKIFGGILADRTKPDHLAALVEHGIKEIDIVVVNLYDFANQPDIEQIDIGGPSLIRAAAKNALHVVPVIDPDDYNMVVGQIMQDGSVGKHTREDLAIKVFAVTAKYETMIARWMREQQAADKSFLVPTFVLH